MGRARSALFFAIALAMGCLAAPITVVTPNPPLPPTVIQIAVDVRASCGAGDVAGATITLTPTDPVLPALTSTTSSAGFARFTLPPVQRAVVTGTATCGAGSLGDVTIGLVSHVAGGAPDAFRLVLQPPYPFAAESGPIVRDGKFFRTRDGKLWTWRGWTEFMLPARFFRGEDVTPVFEAARQHGANVLRVFARVDPARGWPAWADYRNPEQGANFASRLGQFFDLAAAHGLRVEYTVLTYPDDVGTQRAQLQQAYDAAAGRWNVFIETGNECDPQGIDCLAADAGVDHHGVLSAYGYYDPRPNGTSPTTLSMLDYVTVHTDRGPEWPRKAKDLLELRDGFGDASNPAQWFLGTGRPTIGDEPIGAAETEQPGRRTASASDEAAFFGVCGLYSAGCTYHFDLGLQGQAPAGVQAQIADAVLAVWKFIPPIVQTGQYTRGGLGSLPVVWNSDADSLRTYASITSPDAWVVEVRPAPGRVLTPVSGWTLVEAIAGGTIAHLRAGAPR